MGKQSIVIICKYPDEDCLSSQEGLCCHYCINCYSCKSRCENTPEQCGCERTTEQPPPQIKKTKKKKNVK